MEFSNDNGCLVCGVENPVGFQTRPVVDGDAARARLTVTIPQRFQGWRNVAHGGILATLLDEVSIYACLGQGRQCVTAGIKVRYLKPVPVERELIVTAEVVETRRRRSRVLARLEIDGVLHAEAETTVIEIRDQGAAG